jgi:membrane protein DedA with SNARE-associated domain
MIEWLVDLIQGLPIWGLFVFTFVIAYVENVFPPSPSDVVLVFIGSVIGIGTLPFLPTVLIATLGSVLGFSTAYWMGRVYGLGLVSRGWVPFVSLNLIEKVQTWFDKYHGLIIVVNRFLAGTRAVVSFTAGITKMKFPRTLVYCFISALVWNGILLWIGMQVGTRWRMVDTYLSAYGWIITGILALGVIVWYVRKRRRRYDKAV